MSKSDPLSDLVNDALEHRRKASLNRRRTLLEPISPAHVEIDGHRYVNFSSNDYLGLSRHPAVVEATVAATNKGGVGAAASPLITGYTAMHESAERAIAAWKGTESAIVLSSGYQANHAAIQTIAAAADTSGRSVRFLLDKLAHASLIDAMRGSGQPFRVFGHNDLAKLKRLLANADAGATQVVVTESIFSMDGDAADLEGLAALKRERAFVLVLDEAHASGVYGQHGAGYASERGLSDIVDVNIVTMSKALGCAGGAICGSKAFCDAVVNFGRAYIYSTALAPALARGCETAIEVMRNEPHRQQRVRELARRVRNELASSRIQVAQGDSPIVPVILGDEPAALRAAAQLKEDGMLVMPVRPPTVPKGTSRLRVTLCCEHSDQEVAELVRSIIAHTASL
jgi:8-amino-7-oxononanoate synthase